MPTRHYERLSDWITLVAKCRRRQNMTGPSDSTSRLWTRSNSFLHSLLMSVIHFLINAGLSRTSTCHQHTVSVTDSTAQQRTHRHIKPHYSGVTTLDGQDKVCHLASLTGDKTSQPLSKMVNGFRFYRVLESISIASALSTALTIYPCQIRVHQTLSLNSNFLQLGRSSGGQPQRTVAPGGYLSTVKHTALAEIEPQPSDC